jgi:hypothetical protein
VRTTVTLDDDVANLLQRESRRSGDPFKQVLNRAVRAGLTKCAVPAELPRFKVRAKNIGVPDEWLEGSTQELLDRLDGPFAR